MCVPYRPRCRHQIANERMHVIYISHFYSVFSVLRHWRNGDGLERRTRLQFIQQDSTLRPFAIPLAVRSLLVMPPLVQSATCIFVRLAINLYTSNNYVQYVGVRSRVLLRAAHTYPFT